MAPRFEATDHYVLRRLGNDLLPWMAGGKLVTRQWIVYLALAYGYGAELTTMPGGSGIGKSITPLFQGTAALGTSATDLLQGPWFWVGAAALGFWLVVRLIVGREDAVARSLLARDCARTMQKLQKDLDDVLLQANPLPKLGPIRDAVLRKVGDAIDKGIWRWDPPFPASRQIDLEVGKRMDDIRIRFMDDWDDPPPSVGV
jgi:hypothetical protein